MTDLAATPMEAKKHGLTQRQDGGWTLSLNIHPNDIPTWLLAAPMGQRLAVVIAALNDDETTEIPKEPEKKRWHQLKRSCQAALACKDYGFQEWIGVMSKDPFKREDECADRVRTLCAVGSRSWFDQDEGAGETWDSLYMKYLAETGRMAEPR